MLNIRHFQPLDEEYRACIRVSDLYWPDQPPGSIEAWKFGDAEHRKDKLRQRFVVELNGELIGSGTLADPYWLEAEGKFQFNYAVLPEHDTLTVQGQSIHSLIEAFVLEELRGRCVRALMTGIRADKAARVAWLETHGYRCVMRELSSALPVAEFDFAPFAGHVEKVEAHGIAFHTLAWLQEHDPDWHGKLYEAWVEIDLDVPSPDPPRPVSVEDFDKMFRHPTFAPDIWIIAVEMVPSPAGATLGPYAGLTAVGPALTQADRWYIWLTGVRRAFRRRGIATAIKLKSIALAQAHGGRQFETGNEENNPMYNINLKLGFKPLPAWQDWERPVA